MHYVPLRGQLVRRPLQVPGTGSELSGREYLGLRCSLCDVGWKDVHLRKGQSLVSEDSLPEKGQN